MVSIDRFRLKREALRFSDDFVHLLSSERLFKFQRHLIEDYRYDELILITVHTSGSGLFISHTDISNSANTSFGEKSQWRYEFFKISMS